MRVLVVEDEARIARFVAKGLREQVIMAALPKRLFGPVRDSGRVKVAQQFTAGKVSS
jgi:DNA-binding response OmpR family regulator